MRIVVKEINEIGDFLVYQTTDDNINISCEVTTKDKLDDLISELNNDEVQCILHYDYKNYIKQDEINE